MDFDIASLQRYVDDQLPEIGEIESVEKFSNGQSNPTFKISTTSDTLVLRRKPGGQILKSAHAIDREYRVLTALLATDVPVARPLVYCHDANVIGAEFYLMSFVDAQVFTQPELPGMSNQQRSAHYQAMNELMCRLHRLDVRKIGLSDFGRWGDYFPRQFKRWRQQYQLSETGFIAEMETLMTWIDANMPDDDQRTVLVHGDFRIDNILFDSQPIAVAALVDWELSTLGHPYADLAYQCMQWRMPQDCAMPGLGALDRSAVGIPTEAEYVDQYCRFFQLDGIADWRFYLVFNFFRFAAILQGIKKRAIEGNASNEQAHEMGEMVIPLAKQAVELLDSSLF